MPEEIDETLDAIRMAMFSDHTRLAYYFSLQAVAMAVADAEDRRAARNGLKVPLQDALNEVSMPIMSKVMEYHWNDT